MDKKKEWQLLKNACRILNEKFSKIGTLEELIHEKLRKIYKNKPVVTFLIAILFFVGVALFHGVIHVGVDELYHNYFGSGVDNPKEDIIKPTKIHKNLTTGDNGYICIWEPCTNSRAPKKGWLVVENPFYKISINIDHSYYMIFDKKRNEDILIYNDTVKTGNAMLTGCDLGFCDHGGSNPVQYATTALHDTDGIKYEIVYDYSDEGFVLIDTKGWDTRLPEDARKIYDVEAEVIFGIFANEPYFINAVELSNLQRLGYGYEYPKPFKNPDEIVQSWVIIDDYQYACMKGGDNANADWAPPIWYDITDITTLSTERKPWHTGSATFSKMFPEHILLGEISGGGIIFSLPEGIFRFDDSLGVYGDQIAGEFIINEEKPQKAIVFAVNPVNEFLFFYDSKEFNAVVGYKGLMKRTCEKYGLEYPNGTLDAHNWKTKRYAYVITLTGEWHDADANQVSDEIWALADRGLADFYHYQEIISKKMDETTPLPYQ
jgi:hypothetical protein